MSRGHQGRLPEGGNTQATDPRQTNQRRQPRGRAGTWAPVGRAEAGAGVSPAAGSGQRAAGSGQRALAPHHPLHDDDLGPQRLADGENVHQPQAEHDEIQREDDAPGVEQRRDEPGPRGSRDVGPGATPGPRRPKAGHELRGLRGADPPGARGPGSPAPAEKPGHAGLLGTRRLGRPARVTEKGVTAGQTRAALAGSGEVRARPGHWAATRRDRAPTPASGVGQGTTGGRASAASQARPRGSCCRVGPEGGPGPAAHLQVSPAMKSRMAAMSSLFQKSLRYSSTIFTSPHSSGGQKSWGTGGPAGPVTLHPADPRCFPGTQRRKGSRCSSQTQEDRCGGKPAPPSGPAPLPRAALQQPPHPPLGTDPSRQLGREQTDPRNNRVSRRTPMKNPATKRRGQRELCAQNSWTLPCTSKLRPPLQ